MWLIIWKRLLPTGKMDWKLDQYWLFQYWNVSARCCLNHENTFPLEFRLRKEWLEIRAEFTNEEKANESSLSLCVMAATVQCTAGRDPTQIWGLVTALICTGGAECMKAKCKRHDGKHATQYHGFPKDCNNSGIDGFRGEETRFLKDQENKVLKQKVKETKGWTGKRMT